VIVGCDLSQKDDKSAFVPVWAREDGIVVVHEPVVLTPPSDGTSLQFEDMLEACREMATVWPGCTFVLDPLAGGEYLAQLIDRELPGVRVATYSQAHGPMCLASERLATGIAERRLVHPDDPELNAHVLGAASKQVAEKWRFAKPRGRDVKIDACIALAMAYSTLVAEKPRKAYRTAGFS
jgi:phage terminase large subunit-like protein